MKIHAEIYIISVYCGFTCKSIHLVDLCHVLHHQPGTGHIWSAIKVLRCSRRRSWQYCHVRSVRAQFFLTQCTNPFGCDIFCWTNTEIHKCTKDAFMKQKMQSPHSGSQWPNKNDIDTDALRFIWRRSLFILIKLKAVDTKVNRKDRHSEH